MRSTWPALGAGVLAFAYSAALYGEAALHPSGLRARTAFGDSHAWVFSRLPHILKTGDFTSCSAGFPHELELRPIGWVPGLLSLPLQPWLGPMGATTLLQLLGPALSAAAAALYFGSLGVRSKAACLLGGLAFGCGPVLMGALQTGELPNSHAYLLLFFLAALQWGSRRPGPLPGLALATATLATAFTSPYYALLLPLLWAAHIFPGALLRPWSYVSGLLVAAALLPPWRFYGGGGGAGLSLFRPARRAIQLAETLPKPPPVLDPADLLWGSTPPPGSPWETLHAPSLGTGLALAALLGLFWGRGPGRAWGLRLSLLGFFLALGPTLYLGGQLVRIAGSPIALPVAALEMLGWPAGEGGLYFRFTILLVLGAALLLSRLAARSPVGLGLATLLLALQLAQVPREVFGPRPTSPLAPPADRSFLAAMAPGPGEDPESGAVLELPLQGPTDAWMGQPALLRATLHGRRTTALPRDGARGKGPLHGRLEAALEQASAEPLRDAGVRYLILPRELALRSWPGETALQTALGPPTHKDSLLIWDLGPSPAAPCAPPPEERRGSHRPGRP
jgi:hypothetical protein